jgi:exosortase/archaeosortase family protein
MFFREEKSILLYLVKLFSIFFFLYLGTEFTIGSGSPEGMFDFPWVHQYFFYLDYLRDLLLRAADFCLSILGYETKRISLSVLRIGKSGISLNDACLGYGVMAFWIAFVLADSSTKLIKLKWLIVGLLLLNAINILRICLILLAGYHNWVELSDFDHHAMFNITSYMLIFVMMFFYSKNTKTVYK